MKRTAALLLASLLWLITGLAPVAAEDLGKELYEEFCQNCHGPDKAGLKDYNGSFESFAERLDGVTQEMTDFAGFFDEDEVVALYSYLTEVQ